MNGPELHLQLLERVHDHLDVIYAGVELEQTLPDLANELVGQMRLDNELHQPTAHANHWDQRDAILISYGDSIGKSMLELAMGGLTNRPFRWRSATPRSTSLGSTFFSLRSEISS